MPLLLLLLLSTITAAGPIEYKAPVNSLWSLSLAAALTCALLATLPPVHESYAAVIPVFFAKGVDTRYPTGCYIRGPYFTHTETRSYDSPP